MDYDELSLCTTTCFTPQSCLDYVPLRFLINRIKNNHSLIQQLCSEFQAPSQTKASGQTGEDNVMVTSLGVLVGILLVLLMVVTIGWVWTCWIMRRRERNKTNSEQVRYNYN